MTTQLFYAAGSMINAHRVVFYLGVLGFLSILYLALAVDEVFAGVGGIFLVAMFISGINYYYYKKYPVISFKPSTMEVKLAPAASTKFIKYTHITSIQVTLKQCVIASTTEKNVTIPFSLFSGSDKESIITICKDIANHCH